jgi:hypothetical protein
MDPRVREDDESGFWRRGNPQETRQVHSKINLFLVGLPTQKVTLKSHLKGLRDAIAVVGGQAEQLSAEA